MPEVATKPEPLDSGGGVLAQPGIALGLATLTVAFAFYVGLIVRIRNRSEATAYFLTVLLPVALSHTAIFLFLILGCKIQARGALVFWSLSAAVLLSFGGWTGVQTLFLSLLFGFVLVSIGNVFAQRLFPPEAQGWGISLALGILFLSSAGAFLAWVHLFRWWALALLILAPLIPSLRSGASAVRSRIREGWKSFAFGWEPRSAFALQALFLLGIFAFVYALAPETNSDAIRFYWPYIKLMRHYAGFPDGPRQWSYIIPQAGLVYGSAALILLGKHAVRLSMLLVWAALIGMICRRWTDQPSSSRYALAAVVASTPVLLWVAASLMQDCFVCLAAAALAYLCLEGREPVSLRFWAALGICAGTAWAAKFSLLAYALPLVGFATYRTFTACGLARTIRGLGLAACCALTTLAPWFAHSYLQSANPVFPFFRKLFPSPLWPRGVGTSNLDRFRLEPGWGGWLRWPIDLTYHTSHFVEGFDGKLGLTLLVLLILGLAALWKGGGLARAMTISGIIGTAILWTQTAYIRYWLPGLWLVTMAAGWVLERRLRSPAIRSAVVAVASVIMLSQALFSMIEYYPETRGWPWPVYAHKISWQEMVGKRIGEVEHLAAFGSRWPKIWFTGYEEVGHLQVQPLEATIWELAYHTTDARSKIQYLTSAGCEYWLVNEDSKDAWWFKGLGFSHFFWNQANLAARAGPVALYRMPSTEQALREFDARALPGTDLLLNGSFQLDTGERPDYWLVSGDVRRLSSTPQVPEVTGCLQLHAVAAVRQGIALPPGVPEVELLVSARSGREAEPASLLCAFYFLGFEKDPETIPPEDQGQPLKELLHKEEIITVGRQWGLYRADFSVPRLARYATVEFRTTDHRGEVWIDSVHLLSR